MISFLVKLGIFKGILEYILVRNFFIVKIVRNFLVIVEIWGGMNEFIVEISYLNVICVIDGFDRDVILKIIKSFIVVRGYLSVRCVEKYLLY